MNILKRTRYRIHKVSIECSEQPPGFSLVQILLSIIPSFSTAMTQSVSNVGAGTCFNDLMSRCLFGKHYSACALASSFPENLYWYKFWFFCSIICTTSWDHEDDNAKLRKCLVDRFLQASSTHLSTLDCILWPFLITCAFYIFLLLFKICSYFMLDETLAILRQHEDVPVKHLWWTSLMMQVKFVLQNAWAAVTGDEASDDFGSYVLSRRVLVGWKISWLSSTRRYGWWWDCAGERTPLWRRAPSYRSIEG